MVALDILQRTQRPGRWWRRLGESCRGWAHAGREMLRADDTLFCQQHRTLQRVLQLADVSRPVIGEESSLRLGVHSDRTPSMPYAQRPKKVIDQEGNVLPPLP